MRLALVSTIALAALAAPDARAQLAIVATHDRNNAQESWLAGAVAAGAAAHWQPLSPQLTPADHQRCGSNDHRCLCAEAKRRGASHVLVIGVAPLGARDAVVSAQLYTADDAGVLFEEAVVQPGEAGGDDDGRAVVRDLVARLVLEEGPPPVVPRPAPTLVAPPPDELSVLGMTGLGALGVGVVAAGTAATVATLEVVLAADYGAATTAAVVGSAVAGVALVAGAVILAVDGL